MRIISGFLGGRRFYPPVRKWPTRPTTDIAKEGLFNILNNSLDFDSISVLDLFGGTGSHTIELISRGCTDVTYVDKFAGCVKFISKLSEELKVQDYVNVIRADVVKFLKSNNHQYDYIFAGPPYPLSWLGDIPKLVFEHELLATDGLLVVEHNDLNNFEQFRGFTNMRKYGDTIFSFFNNPELIDED